MPAQGTALGIGSGIENSNALKGQNRFVVQNVVSPFRGWADSHSDRIPRALPWAFLFRPLRGGTKAQHQGVTWRARPRPRHLVESSEREWRPPWEGSMPMDPATEQVLQVALALPEAARLELVEALLAAQEQTSALPFDSAWLSEIRRRSDEVKAGTVQPDPWPVVRERGRKRHPQPRP